MLKVSFAAVCGGVVAKKKHGKIKFAFNIYSSMSADRTFFSGRKSINMILRIF